MGSAGFTVNGEQPGLRLSVFLRSGDVSVRCRFSGSLAAGVGLGTGVSLITDVELCARCEQREQAKQEERGF